MKYTEIQWVPFAEEDKRWWVFEQEIEDDAPELSGSERPTGRVVGQFASLDDAAQAYPQAKRPASS